MAEGWSDPRRPGTMACVMASLRFLDGSLFPLLADRTVVGRRPWRLAISRAGQTRDSQEPHMRFVTARTDYLSITHMPLAATHFEIVGIEIDVRTRFFARDLGSTSGLTINDHRYNRGWIELPDGARLCHDWFTFDGTPTDRSELWKFRELLRSACDAVERPLSEEGRRALQRDLTQAVRLAKALGFDDESARIQRWAAHHMAHLLSTDHEQGGPPDLAPPPGF